MGFHVGVTGGFDISPFLIATDVPRPGRAVVGPTPVSRTVRDTRVTATGHNFNQCKWRADKGYAGISKHVREACMAMFGNALMRPAVIVRPGLQISPTGRQPMQRPSPLGMFGMPTDERPFIHKKILGGIGKIASIVPLPGANIISTVSRVLAGGGGAGGRGAPMPTTVFPTTFTASPEGKLHPGRGTKGAPGPCTGMQVWDPRGFCVEPTSPLGADSLGGDPIEGLYGVGRVPGSRIADIAVCPPKYALGRDGICYQHLPNRLRKYPRGRRPLLTGGEMRAISIAARAGRKMARARSDLVAIGMLKAPARRRKKKA